MRKSSSKSSLSAQNTPAHPTLAIDAKALPETPESPSESSQQQQKQQKQSPKVPVPDSAAADAVFVQVQAANARLMERTPFAIDDVGDEDDESEDEEEEEQEDDQVMDEVRFAIRLDA
jgi:TBC1 domain family member 8/9